MFHQALEGQILVGVGPQGHLAHPCHQLLERRIAGEIHPQGKTVHEQAEQTLHLGHRAAGDGRTHHHVVLVSEAQQQVIDHRHQGHGESGADPTPRGLQDRDLVGGNRHAQAPAAEGGQRRTGMIGR